METKSKGMEVSQISLAQLQPAPWNRNTDSNGELKELTESIKRDGILQPLIIRAIKDNPEKGSHFQIVAGHRRAAAARAAGETTVPCIVADMNDQDAKLANVVENLHRKNLGAMEEARAFQQLQEGNAHTPQTIAELVGKNVKYVYRSLELLKLPKAAQTALEKGILSAAHGHQLARVGPKHVDAATAYAMTMAYHGLPSVEDLKHYISQKMEKDIAHAPFPTDRDYAGKIACTSCPFNTANQDMLFEGAKDGHCTNATCFNAKVAFSQGELKRQGERKWPSIKFLGATREGWGDTHAIKGYIVVAESAKIKAALAKSPEKFGFGIMKPGGYKLKKPTLVLAVNDAALSGVSRDRDNGGYKAPTPEEAAAQEFTRRFIDEARAKVMFNEAEFDLHLWRKIVLTYAQSEYSINENRGWFLAAGITPGKPIKDELAKMPEAKVQKLAWMLMVSSHGTQESLMIDHNEINFKKHQKAWTAECQKQWEEKKDELIANYKKRQEQSQ